MSVKDNIFIRLLQLGHARFRTAHLERLREGIADDVVWYTPGDHPLSGKIVGIDGVIEWLRQSAEVTDGTFRADVHRILTDEDSAAVISTYRGERKGMVLEMPGVQTFRMDPETNKVVEARIWVYDDVFVNKFWVGVMRVRLPATMRQRGQPGTLELALPAAGTVRGVIEELERLVPGASARLVTADGRLHGYVNVYVNGDDVRHGAGLDTPVGDDDELLILPAISGG